MSDLPRPPMMADSKPRLTKKIPTFRVGFSKQLDALRAYAVLSDNGTKPVHYGRVADIIKVHEANVSSMNPFFLEAGLIEKREGGSVPAPAVLEYNRQFGWSNENAAQKLAPIIINTWFGQALSHPLQFRAMSENEAIESLAEACNAGPEAKPQLRMLLDYCEAAGVITRANGQVSAPPPQAVAARATVDWGPPKPEVEETPAPAPEVPPQRPATPAPAITKDAINLNISMQINLAEMRNWPADRIAAFFAGIAQVLAAKNAEG
jgi:hypothetical protein